jgi:putative colanic acid biosynthesis acetyltransferase WcaF
MLDIKSNREARSYSAREFAYRIAWGVGHRAFGLIPRPLFELRSAWLRSFGARIGRHVHIYPSARVYFPWNLTVGDWSSIGEWVLVYDLGKVTIGNKVTISQRAHLCAGSHDYRDPAMPLLKPPIHIADEVWICADAFIGPQVTVAEGAIVGARAVVVKDVSPWIIVAGNPARIIKKRIRPHPSETTGDPGQELEKEFPRPVNFGNSKSDR